MGSKILFDPPRRTTRSDTFQTSYLVTGEEMKHLCLEVEHAPESDGNFPNQEFWILEVTIVLTASPIAKNDTMYQYIQDL